MEIFLICLGVAVLITVMVIAGKNAQRTKRYDKNGSDTGWVGDVGSGSHNGGSSDSGDSGGDGGGN